MEKMEKQPTQKKLTLSKETLQQLKVKTSLKAGIGADSRSGGPVQCFNPNHNEIML